MFLLILRRRNSKSLTCELQGVLLKFPIQLRQILPQERVLLVQPHQPLFLVLPSPYPCHASYLLCCLGSFCFDHGPLECCLCLVDSLNHLKLEFSFTDRYSKGEIQLFGRDWIRIIGFFRTVCTGWFSPGSSELTRLGEQVCAISASPPVWPACSQGTDLSCGGLKSR